MKKNYLLFTLVLIVSVIGFGFGDGGQRYPTGAPAGYTGSPADGQNCTHCHGGTATSVENWIASNIPDSGYVSGQIYNITVAVPGSGEKGFEVSPQNINGDLLGELIAGNGSKLVGNDEYITHSNGVNTDPAIWTFQWVAPAEGTGDVVFYGAFAITRSHTRLSQLLVHEDVTASVTQNRISDFKVYPNPVQDQFSLAYQLPNPERVTIQLYSIDGRLIETFLDETVASGSHTFHASIGQNSYHGIYLMSFKAGNNHLVKKLIVN